MSTDKKILKIDILILVVLYLIFAFTLPTFGFWQTYDQSPELVYDQSFDKLLAYQHPPLAEVKTNSVPYLQAPYFIVLDSNTNTILASRNQNTRIFPASITKLATALTALNIYPLDEVITIKEEYKEGKVMELMPGEKLTVRSLVSATLVFSANDAAYALAQYHPNGVQGFVDHMNLLVRKYNLVSTNFTNYDGLHNDNHYSTVYELSQLGRIAIKNPFVTEIIRSREISLSDVSGQHPYHLLSTNEMIDLVPEIEGLKTGWTPEAGGCFVGLINIDGHYLISVVAQSEDRFGDTQKLIDWAKQNVTWQLYR